MSVQKTTFNYNSTNSQLQVQITGMIAKVKIIFKKKNE